MKLHEIKTNGATIYISLSGVWMDTNMNDVYGDAVYPIVVPADDMQKIIDFFEVKANLEKLEDESNFIDRFEQDGWMPEEADSHAIRIDFDGIYTTKPTGYKVLKKNYYTMVYTLRDAGLITQEYAESIATH